MAKKTDKKLSLKRETLRSLTEDQLRAVAGGTLVDPSIYGQGGLKGGTLPPPPPSGYTEFGQIIIRYY